MKGSGSIRVFVCCLICLLAYVSLQAQVITFAKNIQTQYGAGVGYSVKQTTDGGYIIAGGAPNDTGEGSVLLLKTDAYGDTLWAKYLTALAKGSSVLQTTDGGYVIAGCINCYLYTPDSEILLLKTDSNGNLLWTKTYGGSGREWATVVRQTTDGGFIVGGRTNSYGQGSADMWLVKTDSIGDTLWTKTFDVLGEAWLNDIRQTPDGGYIAVGNMCGGFCYQATLVKFDSAGNYQWYSTFTGIAEAEAYSVQLTADGGYIFVGWTGTNPSMYETLDGYMVKTDSSGSLQWSNTYGGPKMDRLFSIDTTNDGNYIAAGDTNAYDPGFDDQPDVYLIKVDITGNTLWSRSIGKQLDNESAFALQTCSDGGCIITGPGSGIYTFAYLVKTDSNGDIAPIASLKPFGAWGCGAPYTATLYAGSTVSSGTNYYWYFGDGDTGTGTSITHTYNDTGSYTVTLIATNPLGSDTVVRPNYVIVSDSSMPQASFIADDTLVYLPNATINFTNNSTYTSAMIYLVEWYFGDGYWEFWDFESEFDTSWNSSHTYDSAGIYTVILVTWNVCGSDTASITVYVDSCCAPLLMTTSVIKNVSCNGGSDGMATVTVTGGVLPYTFLWSDSSTTDTVYNLIAGTYTVIVTDSGGNTLSDSITIGEPPALALTTDALPDTVGSSVGIAWVNVSGGTSPYSYQWDDFALQTTDTASSLSAGTYTVVVTDGFGCIDSGNVTVGNITGIANEVIFENNVKIYPNPNTGQFTLEMDLQGNTELVIKLYHFTGQLMYAKEFSNVTGRYTQQIDMSKNAKGMYYLQVRTDNNMITRKITFH